MLTQIVVLYMAYMFSLPTWCKVLLGIGIFMNVFKFTFGLYKAGLKDGSADS